jgi:Bacterial protein of unknown function (DUF899)
MGWEQIPLCPMLDKFDTDFGVDQWHGHNAFIHDGTKIYRTCFVSRRGDETRSHRMSGKRAHLHEAG